MIICDEKLVESMTEDYNKLAEENEDMNKEIGNLHNELSETKKENEKLKEKLDNWKYEVKCNMDEIKATKQQNNELKEALKIYISKWQQEKQTINIVEREYNLSGMEYVAQWIINSINNYGGMNDIRNILQNKKD